MNRLKTVAVCVSLILGAALAAPSMAAEKADSGPQVSKAVAKQLKAAQDALAGGMLDEALAKIHEAQGAADKTAYDNYVILILQIQVYNKKQDLADAVPLLVQAAQTQYATPDQQKTWTRNAAAYYFQQKDYDKAIDAANEAIKHGANDSDTLTLVAKAQYLSGKYKDADQSMQDIVNKMEKPDEDSLKLEWQFALKANDDATAAKAVEKLVSFYPKTEYWGNALASLARMDTKDAHLQLNIYRLMLDVGVLKQPQDYAEAAELAFDQGYPGEGQAVLEKAFAANVFTEQRDKDRYQHSLQGYKQRAATDQATLPKQEADADKAATGDALVAVGAAYMSYGQNDKAVTDIQKGITKGGLKSNDEAYLLLGIAQLRAKNNADAQKSFTKVAASSTPGYSRLGKLWALHAGARG